MSLLKRLFRGSSIDPLAPTTLEADAAASGTTADTGTDARSPFAVAGEILPSLGARPEVADEFDEIVGSRTWVRVDGTTTERYAVETEGDATVSIDVAPGTHVPGPGALEEMWARDFETYEFAADTSPPSPMVRMVEADCSDDIAALADALGGEDSDNDPFFTFSLSPTGHTSLTLFLHALDHDRAEAVERIPDAMPPLRALARSMRRTTTAKLGELFPWYTGSPSFKVPANPIEYLERAARILDPIANVPSVHADVTGASWAWSDPIASDAMANASVDATTGSVAISFGSDVVEMSDDSAYVTWTWQPVSRTWTQNDLYEDHPVAQAYLARFGPRVTQLLDQLETARAYEFSICTDRAGNVSLVTSIDVGEESVEHTAAVLDLLRSNLDALRS